MSAKYYFWFNANPKAKRKWEHELGHSFQLPF